MLGGLVSGRMPDRGNQISLLVANNLKLAVLIFKTLKFCSMFNHVNSGRVLDYPHQWELEEKKDDIKVPKKGYSTGL